MIRVIEGLIGSGHAYEVEGDVYFEVETAREKFGTLRHQSLEDMRDGARIKIDGRKRSPKDFALWKSSKEGEISWDSPWGPGRPGWHIECSTMSTKYLGPTLDIHGGGMDLIFPHHESEVLQSECFNNKKFARYWLHNGFVEINSEKMSKSLKNFFTIKDVLERFPPMVIRFFLVYTHYRSPIDFSDVALEEAQRSFGRLVDLHEALSGPVGDVPEGVIPDLGPPDDEVLKLAFELKRSFTDAMDDDFNTRIAVSVLFRFDSEVKRIRAGGNLNKANAYVLLSMMDELSNILGFEYGAGEEDDQLGGELAGSLVQLLIDIRKEARARKDWATSDSIRDRLKELGVILEDGEETTWRIARPGESE